VPEQRHDGQSRGQVLRKCNQEVMPATQMSRFVPQDSILLRGWQCSESGTGHHERWSPTEAVGEGRCVLQPEQGRACGGGPDKAHQVNMCVMIAPPQLPTCQRSTREPDKPEGQGGESGGADQRLKSM
jgi:hypothetical protein